MNRAANEISKGKITDENLTAFAEGMMQTFSDYSLVKYALNYYGFAADVSDGCEKKDGVIGDIAGKLGELSDTFINFSENSSYELLLDKTVSLRKEIISLTSEFLAFLDGLHVFEHCLNRVDYKFKPIPAALDINDLNFTDMLTGYIFQDDDNVTINSRIKEVLSQLPVRMTKNKFFELLAEGLKVYKGCDKSSLNDFIFMIRSSGMIITPKNMRDFSKDMADIYAEFAATEFSALTAENYKDLSKKKELAADYISANIEFLSTVAGLINEIYVSVLALPHLKEKSKISVLCLNVIRNINLQIEKEKNLTLTDDIVDGYEKLEGKQEQLFLRFSKYDYLISQVLDMDVKPEIKEQYQKLAKISLLESGSIFVEFDNKISGVSDEAFISEKTDSLINELKEFFSSHEKLMNRAVMGNILSELPVFFSNPEELRDYISNSLAQCRDAGEKAASIEVLLQIMNEDGYEME